ncbi:MAG: hypothetical protein ABSD27_07845 [Bryobacteraceae bacterium]|jgi:uncharacterized protein (TIGR03437 family)
MRRLILFAAAQALLGAAWAQSIVNVRITAGACGRFWVDGQRYDQAAIFFWPEGSPHSLAVFPNYAITDAVGCTTSPTAVDSNGSDVPTPTVIYASRDITSYTFTSKYSYRVDVIINRGGSWPHLDCAGGPSAGELLIGDACWDHDGTFWVDDGTVLKVTAYAPPGWVFIRWGGTLDYLAPIPAITLTATEPLTIIPIFQLGATVTIATTPPNMKLIVDSALVTAPMTYTWAAGSVHQLAPLQPQPDAWGNDWVFDSWSDGAPAMRQLTVGEMGSTLELTLNYSNGVRVSFGTTPMGLKLFIDGRSNWPYWPSYNFVWAQGSTHRIAAPLQQTGSDGRRYVFREWTIGGPAEQDYVVGPHNSQPATNAVYDILGQLRVESSPSGLTLTVDGSPCVTPCTIDRPAGTAVLVSAPASIPVADGERLDFDGWADGGRAPRTWTAGTDVQVFRANYHTSYRVLVVSDPANGATFVLDPLSVDGFYPAGTGLHVTVDAKPGFKFKYWDGEFDNPLAESQTIWISGPVTLRAVLEAVPFIGISSIRNAAGKTPEDIVGPGSIVSILGAGLAPQCEQGPDSPLAQTLSGVTVQLMDRFLPLLSVCPEQIDIQLYSDLVDGDYELTVHQDGQPDVTGKFTIRRNAPGLFTRPVEDQPFALALHDDGTPVTLDNPAQRNETITLLGTGFGPYEIPGLDGFMVPEGYDLKLVDAVEIRVGDSIVLTPVSAKAAVGYVGRTAIRLKITDALPANTTVELLAAQKDKSDPEGLRYRKSNKVLLPLK